MKHLKKSMCVFLSFVLTFSSVQVAPSHAVAVDTLSDALTEPLAVEQPAPTRPAGEVPATTPSEEPAAMPEQTPVDISRWQALQRMFDEAQDAATIVLDADYTADANDAGLEIPANKSVTLDLAGHTLNRNLTSPKEGGHVILVRGSLSIVDSTATAGIGGKGTITGGKTLNGGGIVVDAGASLRFECGTITGNEAENGGGIFVGPDATLHLAGGIISGNTARGPGGGVLVDSGAKAVIVEGAPVVRSNTANGSGADVFLPAGFVLTMGGTLASEAEVGIALEQEIGTFTSGYATSNGTKNPGDFFTVAEGLEVALSDGEAQVIAHVANQTEAPGEAKDNGGKTLSVQGASPDSGARGVPLTTNAEGDIVVDGEEALRNAMSSATEGQTIVLSADVTTGGTLAVVRPGVSFAIDLAGHAINRNLTEQDEDNNGHVLDVNQGTLTIRDSSAEQTGKITGGFDGNGGGVVIGGEGTLNLESGSITGNQGVDGGGVFVYGTMNMTGGSVSGNSGERGGGIFCKGRVAATGGSVSNNTGGDAGGIYVDGGTIDFTDVSVTGNIATVAGGGGVNNKGYTVLKSCTVSNNSATLAGGGAYNEGELHLSNCTISDNKTADSGGAVSTRNTTTIDGCTLTNNTAAVDGGALYSYGCTTTLTSTTLNANKAEASGGAIRIYGGVVELDHVTLNKNEATWYGGGIYCNNDGAFKLLNGTSITENIGYKGGGGAYVENQTVEVQVGSGVVVKDNQANNIYLTGDRRLTVVEELGVGTQIGVALQNLGGTFTSNFNANNPDTDPSSVFVPEPGYSILRDGDGEARVVTSDWVGLQALIDEAAESGQPIILDRSWQAVDENAALVIPEGKAVSIDLNGYKIDRHRSSHTPDGEVFTVNGTLSLADNSYDKKGAVTGGHGDAGGIRVNSGGMLKLNSGTIKGNHAKVTGGGVCVAEGGVLETFGGAISSNISDGDGGGVYCSGAFTNSECSISGNAAGSVDGTSSLGSGGGVFITDAAAVTINSGTITSNKANDMGGGIYQNGGTLTVKDGSTPVSIASNSANSDGGGIYVAAGTATINAGEIISNSTRGSGGGAFLVEGATLNLYDVSVTDNYAAVDGGGVYNNKGTFGVKGSPRVTGNVGTIGKNVLLAPDSVVTIEDPLVAEGDTPARLDVQTQGYGQAITSGFTAKECSIECFTLNDVDSSHPQVQDDGELHITAGSVAVEVSSWDELQAALDNPPQPGPTTAPLIIGMKNDISADDDDDNLNVDHGDAIGVTLDLRGHVLNRNLSDSEGGDGHVLEVDNNSSLTIIDSVGTGIITGGYADNGGAIYIHEGSSVKIQGGTIRDNRATSDGGGIYACGTFEMTGGSIVRNEAEDNGGGIYASENGSLDLKMANISSNTSGNEGGGLDVRVSNATLWNCSIRNNTAKDDDGGGINIDKSDLLLMIEETDIVGNVSNKEHRGGGIFLNDGRIDVKGGSISDNYASDGGGIFNNECAITLNGTTLSGNRTGKSGGAGISNLGSCQLSNCTFSGNVAEGEGGGIFTSGDDYLTASDCTFSGNESADASGGAICTYRATTLTNCTFTGNKAHYSGGAVCVHGDATIDGGTISGNEATEHGGGIVANEGGTLRLLGKSSDLQITKNSAALSGSGVYVPGNTHYVSIGGKVTVLENEMDSDFFMAGDKCLDVADGIDGSQIRMALERGAGQFTINLANHAAGVDPTIFFLAPAGMSVIPTADGEAQLAASDWPTLQKMIDEAANGATITLDRDWTAAPQNVSLKIAAGKNITIDLAGHTIDRARTEYEAAGEVFSVEGSLTVTDSSEGAAGKACGAYGDGGGIVVRSGGTLNFQSGNISGNKAKTGAGVLVLEGGAFNMTGGNITGNHADADGGGVYSQGSASITGGAITHNEASGSTGGMWAAGTFSIGGTLRILDNIGPQSANLLLASNTVMNVSLSQKLEGSARVDLVAESPNRALTNKLSESGRAYVAQAVFSYDKATDRLEVRGDGELYLSQSQDAVTVSDWQALQNAINDEANRDKVIRLGGDITAGEDDGRLLLDGKSVIVDLGGHKLDRNLSDADDDGHVFELSGNSTLTIRDTAGAGRITGGYAVHGGAINIHEGCTCNIEGGTFCGNRASEEGGAFFVYGALNMRGGMLTQNSAESGGAIFVHENGTVNIQDIAIVNNQANKWGGGAVNNKGNATLTGCVIKNNWADNEGGGIYNGDKQLTLKNCTVTNNSSSAGGGLCCYGTVNINDTTISNNYGDDYGGGLFMRGIVTISGGAITGNTGKTDGGGIHNLGGLLTVTGTDISSNSTEAGGGALNNKGTATLTSCTMSNNHANAEGGGIYASIDSGTTIDGCTLQGNSSGNDGGAISACGVMTVANSTISQNTTDAGGAGLYSYGGTTITNTTITENKAKQSGGGLLARTRTLTLENATVTKNSASNLGGGLMVEGGSDAVVIKGVVTIKDNNGSGDVYLSDGKLLTVGGALENDTGATSMGVRIQNGVGVVFTSGYSNDNSGKEPATYFTSNDGYLVYLEGTEASTKKETIDDNSFVEPGSQINRNNGQLTGVNWMSGISGERRINEINIPGTHDSGTKAVLPNLTTGYLMELVAWIDSPLGALVTGLVLPPVALISMLDPGLIAETLSEYVATFANCQTRYIDELLEDGIRHLDFRLNTYCVAPGWPPNPKSDNGEDLYLCHGKNEKVGTFYAYDERTSSDDVYSFITFKRALSWIKAFLEEHPTETLTMVVAVESVDDVYDEGMARIRKHLHEELATQINPSTGKPYLYMEDGVFGKKLTEYPQLKDCRGQVILECSAKDAEILGGAVKEDVVSRVIGPDGNFEETAGPKIAHLRQFFADHGYDDLPSTAKEAIDYLYSVGLNGTDPSSIPMVTPLQIAEDVLEAMFGENGLVIDKVGKYLGRINMDGETAEYSKIVWSSNFFDTLQYCKVTTKSGMNDDVAQTSYILYGTMLPIPECIYNNPNSEGKYFQYWEAQYDNSVSGNVYQFYPGEEFGITGDITFTAKWGEQQQTPVRVVWRDAENADKLRPDKLSITAGGTNVDIQPTKNWRVYLPGNVVPGDITVNWDKIGGDTDGQYACEVREHESGYGIVIELTHTPQKQVQAKGTVRWVDRDDAAGKRPENVTVHLLADSRVIDSVTTTAENDWAWDLGERPVFVDGQKVNYSVDEDPVDGYVTYTKSSEDTGFEITNVLGGAKQSTNLTGLVYWTDNDNAGSTRPRSVTINLFRDGEKIDAREVVPDKSGYWVIDFEVSGSINDASYSITEEPVKGYTTTVIPMENTGGMLIVSNILEGHEHKHKTVSGDMLKPTCTEVGLHRTIEYCEECGELFSDVQEDISALGHDWGDWQKVIEATETRMGLETRTCKRDKTHTQSRVVPMTGHVHGLTHVAAKAATCTEDGNTEYWTCTEGENPCGLRFADAAGTEWVHEEATVTHALGHDWGAWEVTQEPTEVSPGIERRVCSHDSAHVEVRMIPKKKHVHGLTHVAAKAATCTEDGNIEYWKCTEGDDPCGMCFRDAAGTDWVHEEGTIARATGHDWGEWRITKPATESEKGEMVRVCHNDFTHTQTRAIPKVGHIHSFVRVAAKPATCTEDGNIEYWKCTEGDDPCGLCFRDPAGGEWVHEEAIVIHALGHVWGEPTYEWGEGDATVTATRVCLRNPSHTEQETVAAGAITYVQPTCTEPGKATVISQPFVNPGFLPQSKSGQDVPALGHDWDEWVVTKPATETEEGQETRTCARCGETETRAIPARIAYSYVGPDGQAWTKGGTEALTFTFKRSFADELTFGLFADVEVDEKAVHEKDASGKPNYTVESGSLILHLRPSFLESLAEGDHTVTARFQDGSASAAFSVKAASRKDQKKTDDTGTGNNAAGTGNADTGGTGSSTSSTQSTRTSTPKTGDASSVTAGAVMVALIGLALGAFALARKKRRA